MGFLQKFLEYENIVVQCHDNPDADALASGFALYKYLKNNDKNVTFIYSGRNRITKPNLVLMRDTLGIPVMYIDNTQTEFPPCDILITTDCQYGESNVTHFDAPVIAMIDHHQVSVDIDDNCLVRPNLASCSTIIWDLLHQEGIDVNDDMQLATALYYGLYTDSNRFEELFHPVDRDMRDMIAKDDSLIFHLINSNLSIDELGIASRALTGQHFDEDKRYSVICADPCDPNILGVISDFVIQVDQIDTCVAYSPNQDGYKLSVRSCVKLTKANELAGFLCEGIGNGGGHLNKAGGFIVRDLFEKKYPDMIAKARSAPDYLYRRADDRFPDGIGDYLFERMRVYHDIYEIIYASDYEADTEKMSRYVKLPVTVGYVKADDIVKEGMPILIRTLEGDIDLEVEDDMYLMIGVEGEVYPIREKKFKTSYELVDELPETYGDYSPTVRDTIYGNVYSLSEKMKGCRSKGTTGVYAMKLDHPVKVFTAWDQNKYYRGLEGDYLVVREDDLHDVYIVRDDIFDKTYEAV
ncbi:MAG: DHH family phosphoesterase [Eubacterium sp.]|nr:DHH family phosphoesterase [Eubacterium sp.]